jgi:hypothetical protein
MQLALGHRNTYAGNQKDCSTQFFSWTDKTSRDVYLELLMDIRSALSSQENDHIWDFFN